MTDELPPLPTELELDALTLPPEAKPHDGLSRTLERVATHWHRDRENRIAFVRRNAARDLPAWEQPDDAAINDLQRRIVEMAGAIPLLVAANFLPARPARAPSFPPPARMRAPYAGEMHAPLDDRAQSNRTLRHTIEDLRAEVVRKMEHAGQDAGGVAASTCLRELLEAMPNGALLPRHGTDWLRFAVVWPQVIAAWRAERAAELGARWKLHDAAERGETQAADPNALGRLQQAIAEHLAALREACALPLTEAQLGSMAEVDGMAAVEAAALAYMREKIDAADAEQVRPLRQDEWRARTGLPGTGLVEYVGRWLDPVHPAKTLAAVLWRTRIRPMLEAESSKPRAVALPIIEQIQRTHRRGMQIKTTHDGAAYLVDARGEAQSAVEAQDVPAVELESLQRLLPRGVSLLGTVNAHRLILWEVATGHRQCLEQRPDPRTIIVEGGWSALAEQIGASAASGKAQDQLRALVMAQAHLRWNLPDGTTGNLLSYSIRPSRPGQPARVTIVLGDMLLPNYVHGLHGEHRTNREARKLVPMLAALPPAVGPPNVHGAQASLHLEMLADFRRRAPELVRHGGVLYEREHFRMRAGELGLAKWADAILNRWTADGDDGPAFLQRVSPDRYTLGVAHTAARDFLNAAGQAEIEGQANGRKGVARRHRVKRARR